MVMEERTSEYSTRMQLQIRDFQASDVGVYTCISTNSLGKSDGTIRFYGEKTQDTVLSSVSEMIIISKVVVIRRLSGRIIGDSS